MGRFYNTPEVRKSDFTDFIYQPNLQLEKEVINQEGRNEVMKGSLSNFDFNPAQTFQGWDEAMNNEVEGLNQEMDEVTQRLVKNPSDREGLAALRTLKRKANKMYTTGNIGKMSRTYANVQKSLAETDKRIKAAKTPAERAILQKEKNKHLNYIQRQVRGGGVDDFSYEEMIDPMDAQDFLNKNIDLDSLKNTNAVVGKYFNVKNKDGSYTKMLKRGLEKSFFTVGGNKVQYIPNQFEGVTTTSEGYNPQVLERVAFERLKGAGYADKLSQEYRLYGVKEAYEAAHANKLNKETGRTYTPEELQNKYIQEKFTQKAGEFALAHSGSSVKEKRHTLTDTTTQSKQLESQKAANRRREKQMDIDAKKEAATALATWKDNQAKNAHGRELEVLWKTGEIDADKYQAWKESSDAIKDYVDNGGDPAKANQAALYIKNGTSLFKPENLTNDINKGMGILGKLDTKATHGSSTTISNPNDLEALKLILNRYNINGGLNYKNLEMPDNYVSQSDRGGLMGVGADKIIKASEKWDADMRTVRARLNDLKEGKGTLVKQSSTNTDYSFGASSNTASVVRAIAAASNKLEVLDGEFAINKNIKTRLKDKDHADVNMAKKDIMGYFQGNPALRRHGNHMYLIGNAKGDGKMKTIKLGVTYSNLVDAMKKDAKGDVKKVQAVIDSMQNTFNAKDNDDVQDFLAVAEQFKAPTSFSYVDKYGKNQDIIARVDANGNYEVLEKDTTKAPVTPGSSYRLPTEDEMDNFEANPTPEKKGDGKIKYKVVGHLGRDAMMNVLSGARGKVSK